jgi:hypothetical protein
MTKLELPDIIICEDFLLESYRERICILAALIHTNETLHATKSLLSHSTAILHVVEDLLRLEKRAHERLLLLWMSTTKQQTDKLAFSAPVVPAIHLLFQFSTNFSFTLNPLPLVKFGIFAMSSSSVAISSFSQVSAHSMGFCSTSSTSSPFDGPVVVDKTGFLQSAFRAGGPYLCSLPARMVWTGRQYDAETVYQMEGYAKQVLRDLHLQYRDIQLVGRHSQIDPEAEQVHGKYLSLYKCNVYLCNVIVLLLVLSSSNTECGLRMFNK